MKVPPGVDTGTRLKLSGEGEPAPVPGGTPGDLYVVLQVREHPIFTREDTEVLCEMPISLHAGRARRDDRRAHARRPGEDEGPRRHADAARCSG